MTAAELHPSRDPYHVGHHGPNHAVGRGEGGPAPKRIVVSYGFWIFLLSDVVMFSAFFAAYAVLGGQTAGGPGAARIFDLRTTALETACLLLSSFTCGAANASLQDRRMNWFYLSMAATFLLGLAFIGLEAMEFAGLVVQGDGPQRSAFLSSFFALVGCHGAHVTSGLLWLLTMAAQVRFKGLRPEILRRFMCFNLFWHVLDVIWVAIFTEVYLMGVR
jgi:cytochrome o ubiquinol oxidase subunit 3